MEKRKIQGELYNISQNADELFDKNTLKQKNANYALDYMNDCINMVYHMVKPHYPKVFRPKVYIADSNKKNAVALDGKEIIIYAGILWDIDKLIRKRYTKEILERYNILRDYSLEEIISGIRIYVFRFIVLHELYHLWNGHYTWQRKYYFDKNGDLKDKIQAKTKEKSKFSNAKITQEHLVKHNKHTLNSLKYQELISRQAFEIDADSSAVCMLINLLMCDIENQNIQDKEKYVKNEMGLIICALVVTFNLFDGNAGAKFERLKELETTTHPISAIRMVYAIEIAECCLSNYFSDINLENIESEWLKIICDVECDYEGKVDMGQVFYFPAYTEKAQRHLCCLKRRITDMYDTLFPMVLGNIAPKLEDEDIEFCEELVRFTEDGKSTKGWINPSSGTPYAKRAPIVKEKTPERNAPCPCGSGKKYKHCCGKS